MNFESRVLKLFRVFIPSWRFFDSPGIEPILMHRSGTSKSSLGPWIETLPEPSRSPWNLVLNSKNNLIVAYHSLVQQFLDDLEEVNPVSYELVTRMVGAFACDEHFVQWKLMLGDEDVFISDVERMNS